MLNLCKVSLQLPSSCVAAIGARRAIGHVHAHVHSCAAGRAGIGYSEAHHGGGLHSSASKMATVSVLLPEPVRAPGAANEPEIIVRPMLTTAQKNFKDISHCGSILAQACPPEITRQDLNVPGSRCVLLHGLLTPEECHHYIRETEKIGYSDLSDLFPAAYRSNDRVLAICKPLVECLWKRIEPFLTRKEVIRVRPIGFGNEGTWKPFRLNECCKFGRYK